jgi:chromosome segregation ATPase
VHSVQNRRWLALRRKTQRLDASTQGQLHDFLNDHVGSKGSGDEDDDINNHEIGNHSIIPDDFEVLQKQLDNACARQVELEEKEQFLKIRLESYQAKLDGMERMWNKRLIDESDEKSKAINDARQMKLQKLKEALQSIKKTYTNLEMELIQLQQQISSMCERQLELKMKTEECKVVLEELEHTTVQAADSSRPVVARGTDGLNDEEQGTNLVMTESLHTTTSPLEIESSFVVLDDASENVDELIV